jgi:hypothetical protein
MSDRDDHRPEPEIIPPGPAPIREREPARWEDQNGRHPGRDKGRERVWVWSNDPRYAGLRPGRINGLGLALVIAAVAALGTLGFFVFLGVVAIALPLIAVVVIAGLLSRVLRRL